MYSSRDPNLHLSSQGHTELCHASVLESARWEYLHQGSWQALPSGFGCVFFFFFCFLGLHPPHVEVSRLGVHSELQLPASATATAMLDLSCVCNLQHSSHQCWILNPLSEARIEPTSTWILVRFVKSSAKTGTPVICF